MSIFIELILQSPALPQTQVIQSPSLNLLTQVSQIIATAIGVGIAAYVLIYTHADKIIKQLKEVKNLTNRNNTSIQDRSDELKIKTDGLYGFIDAVQKHQAEAIGETNHKISGVEKELQINTELTSSNSERIEKLEKLINSQTAELKESFGDESKKGHA